MRKEATAARQRFGNKNPPELVRADGGKGIKMANNDNDVAQGKPTESLTVEASAATAKMEELKPCPMTWERAFKIVSSRLSMVCASGSGLKEFLDAGSLKEFTQAEVDQRPSPPAPDPSSNVQVGDVPGKQYAERDPEAQGEYYMRHLSAMTGERLHEKSDIAAELAHRDIQIDTLTDELVHARAERDALRAQVAEMPKWVSISDRLPTHEYSVALWIIGGPIHFGEDYIDMGIYNTKRCKWQTHDDGAKDMDVEVSHWMDIRPPDGKSFPADTLSPSPSTPAQTPRDERQG